MVYMSADHIGYGFNSPMGMHGKSLDVIGRIFGSEMIKQQKRIEMIQRTGSNTSDEFYTGALDYWLRLN